jgi:hypothetical protein
MRAIRFVPAMLLSAAACSTYEADWAAAPAPPPATMLGRWEGTWLSEVNAHTGPLRCIITARPDGHLDARYHAGYAWGPFDFTFEYTVPMGVERRGDTWHFRGEAELGCWIAGGLYRYEGQATAAGFDATYAGPDDRGVFKMGRPTPRP